MESSNSNSNPHIALLSSPGVGHLIPALELGKRLVTQHNFKVTLFAVTTPTSASRARSIIQQAAMGLNKLHFDIIQLPTVDVSSIIKPGARIITILRAIMREMRPSLRSAIISMESKPTALIVDMFGTESIPIADELNMLKFLFIDSNAWFFAFFVYAPLLDKQVQGEYSDMKEPVRIPGCSPIRPEDLIDQMLDRTDQEYSDCLQMGTEMLHSDGVLINTWEPLQQKDIKSLRADNLLGRIVKSPIYPVGPVVKLAGYGTNSATELFGWLDKQPRRSVIYVSFGSAGTLSFQQMTELAWGLELSKTRFIWKVRAPVGGAVDGAYLSTGSDDGDPSSYLPKGFMTRTRDLGLLISEWAPQESILSHPSVGGFLSHCGWNSALESLANGVPMIAWPLFAEQRMNAALLVDEHGVAIRPKVLPTKKVVDRDEVKDLVRRVMEEEEGKTTVREKAKELKRSAERAVVKGGSSYEALAAVAEQVRKKVGESTG